MGLFKPAWMGKNEAKALAAVNATGDEATLRRIVDEAPLNSARAKAAKKIGDQELYKRLAESDPDRYFRHSMAMCVDDIGFLEAFAQRSDNMQPGEIRDRIDSLKEEQREAANQEVLAEIPAMDDIARLVEIATSDYTLDVGRFSRIKIYGAPEPLTTEGKMRLAAVDRLAELGANDALVEITLSRNAQMSSIAEKAAAKIADQQERFRVAADDSASWNARATAVEAITDRALLARLAEMSTEHHLGETPIEKLAAQRLREMRSEDICHGEHDWEYVCTEDDEVGDTVYRDTVYRCKRCDIERRDHESIRL